MHPRARSLWLALIIGSAIRTGTHAVQAQTPHSTSRAAAPSILSDTIYRLAVDSARYPDHASILLLDDAVITVQADGRNTATGGQGSYPKNRFPDVVAWLRECAKDHAPIIVIDHGPPTVESAER